MASIIRKRKGDNYYYYAVRTQRVNGKPRIVWQKYLGSLDSVVRKCTQDPALVRPCTAVVSNFGLPTALWSLASELRLVEIINSHVGKRNQGLSVGEYMVIAAVNRGTCPTSKQEIGHWYEKTSLARIHPVPPKSLSSQRFWDNMQYLDEETINNIQVDVARQMISVHGLDLRCVIYDTTNFFTYIDTATPSSLAQRGKNKAKRADLKQVNLGLMACGDFYVPLFHEVYPGNVNDVTHFRTIADQLSERYEVLGAASPDITLVLDKGNISQKNIAALDLSPFRFITSVSPSDFQELLKAAESRYSKLTGECVGDKAYRTTMDILGATRTVVVTFNETLRMGQLQGVMSSLMKVSESVKELQFALEERRMGAVKAGRPYTRQSVEAKVEKILSQRYVRSFVKYDVNEEDGVPTLEFSLVPFEGLQASPFGATVLITNNHDWSTERIVSTYRRQSAFENDFRQMKDPKFVSWSPMFHWTNHNIRVHAFYCVLSLALRALLYRKLKNSGFKLSIDQISNKLSDIREVAHIYPRGSGIKSHLTLSELDSTHGKLLEALNLHEYAPGPVVIH